MSQTHHAEKLAVWANSGRIYTKVQDEGNYSLQVRIFDTNGRLVIDWAEDGRAQHRMLPAAQPHGKQLAHGVYLAVITVRDETGNIMHSEVKKWIIQR